MDWQIFILTYEYLVCFRESKWEKMLKQGSFTLQLAPLKLLIPAIFF